jgi:hypothetical protein
VTAGARNKLIRGFGWWAIRKDPELHEFYRRVYERHPWKVAARKVIVAVARKLTPSAPVCPCQGNDQLGHLSFSLWQRPVNSVYSRTPPDSV